MGRPPYFFVRSYEPGKQAVGQLHVRDATASVTAVLRWPLEIRDGAANCEERGKRRQLPMLRARKVSESYGCPTDSSEPGRRASFAPGRFGAALSYYCPALRAAAAACWVASRPDQGASRPDCLAPAV